MKIIIQIAFRNGFVDCNVSEQQWLSIVLMKQNIQLCSNKILRELKLLWRRMPCEYFPMHANEPCAPARELDSPFSFLISIWTRNYAKT